MLKESQEQTAPRVPQEPQEPRELQVPPDLKVLQEPKLDPTALSRVPRVIPASQEKTEQMEKEVMRESLDKKDSLLLKPESQERQELTVLREREEKMKIVNQMISSLAIVILIPWSFTLRLLVNQTVQPTTQHSGPDTRYSSSKAKDMDTLRILAVLVLA